MRFWHILAFIAAAGAAVACSAPQEERTQAPGILPGGVSVFYVQKPSGLYVQCVLADSKGVDCDWSRGYERPGP